MTTDTKKAAKSPEESTLLRLEKNSGKPEGLCFFGDHLYGAVEWPTGGTGAMGVEKEVAEKPTVPVQSQAVGRAPL